MDERRLAVELDGFAARMDAWATQPDFVDRHGSTGGWDPTSHDLFVQAWRQCGGRLPDRSGGDDEPAPLPRGLVRRCTGMLGRTETELREHVAWWIEHNRLLDARRTAVTAWRAAQRESASIVKDASDALADDEQPNSRNKPDRTQHERQLAEVLAWRLERQEREMQEQARAAREEHERAERERREWAKRQERLKKLVAERRRSAGSRTSASPSPSTVAATTTRPSVPDDVAERIKARSEAMVAQRRSLALEKMRQAAGSTGQRREWDGGDSSDSDDERDIEGWSRRVFRDPSRVLAPTAASAQRASADAGARQRAEREAVSRFAVCSGARALPRRAVPTWRAGV
ncbi:hypothetical protein H9P43_001937 [Blastocladiella emersonii ATCC 22665]|nr:hypothetical protein H9P43_001937 [Blastocladiella emersonii ATCC 22665]